MFCYRFVGKPLNVECNEKTAPTNTSLSLDATIGLFEVVECLFDRRSQNADPEYTEVRIYTLITILRGAFVAI